ncbi:low-density lipoprotein receptor-related protein 3-like [Gigantopelta aegis]|uniref:low-density lipoprotein receptor-related protein 3-like n=1 Tax=Gigantopelta aegis TaxID=1735272 RepID=UPI001B88D925|nr:low-density lipoprotein receptor-related protein 3-like [Gigantopelta aegis]
MALKIPFLLILAVLFRCGSSATYFTEYIDEFCGKTFEVNSKKTAGILKFSRSVAHQPNLECPMTLRAPKSQMLMVQFTKLDLERDDECIDWVQMYDGKSKEAKRLSKHLCGKEELGLKYVSSQEYLAILVRVGARPAKEELQIVYNSFHMVPCEKYTFECDNGRCISAVLSCAKYDHCGDKSNSCGLVMWIAVGVVVTILVIIGVCVGVCCCIRKRKQNQRMQQGGMQMQAPPRHR